MYLFYILAVFICSAEGVRRFVLSTGKSRDLQAPAGRARLLRQLPHFPRQNRIRVQGYDDDDDDNDDDDDDAEEDL